MSDHWFTDEQLEAAAEAVAKLRFIPGSHLVKEPEVGNFEREMARAALLAAAPQWRPIESAPKCTPILAHHKTLGRAVIILRDLEMDGIKITVVASVMFDPRQVRDVAAPYMTQTNLEDFDLWQPIPPAPRPATPPVAGVEGGDTKPLPVSSPETSSIKHGVLK